MNRLAPVVATLFVLLASAAALPEAAAESTSWMFRPSNFSHDPTNGARVAQYVRKPPIEPLPDTREVTSRYRRTRTNLRGTDGSLDSYYEVQAWGNGRGGIDAEWERVNNAWQNSYLTGSQTQGGYGRSYGYPQYGGYPGAGYAPPIYQPGAPAYGNPHHPHHGGHKGRDRKDDE